MVDKNQLNYLFRVTNGHSESCGTPPSIDGDTPNKRYSYFQNEYGEQSVFEYDLKTKQAVLWSGDANWEKSYAVRDGQVDLIMSKSEAMWLKACWYAAAEWDKANNV